MRVTKLFPGQERGGHAVPDRGSCIRGLLPLAALVLCLSTLSGCDRVTRYQTLSTLFDGVPNLPPVEELCREERDRSAHADQSGQNKQAAASAKDEPVVMVSHAPYAQKRCSDCHGADKDKQGGLIVPRQELCFVCHKDFLKGEFQHGPAAVGDCLACHAPHSSSNKALLIVKKEVLCSRCHKEERLAQAMHDRFRDKGIACVECHDPHAGRDRFFLK